MCKQLNICMQLLTSKYAYWQTAILTVMVCSALCVMIDTYEMHEKRMRGWTDYSGVRIGRIATWA